MVEKINEIWRYEHTETGIKLFGYNEEKHNVIVPETIDGKPVEVLYFALVSSEVKSIFIPKTVKEIVMWGYPISLETIEVDENNEWFSSRDGVLYNKDASILVRFPCAKEFNNQFLDGVVEISSLAFADVQRIYSVDFPLSVRKIGADAFNYCETLKSVTMTDNVVEIGPGAFCGCGLEEIKLSENIHEFEVSTYDDEGSGYFSGCDFREYIVPDHIMKIGSLTFENNKKLRRIYIPASVETIEKHAFYGCESLEEIIIEEGNKSYYSIDGVLFSRDGTILHYPQNKKDFSFTIPKTIKKIGAYAFYKNKNLKHLMLGENIHEIGYRAFTSSHIESINIPANVKRIEKDVFLYTAIKELYIPKSIQYIEMNSGTAGNINPYKDMLILVDKDSYAEKMCIKYNLTYNITSH